ncbi:MAG: DEAD/DEAH box helicase family protein [Candidatus Brocadiales bacterium]
MLRDYQLECLENIASHRECGRLRQLVVLPTGCGKTFVFAPTC